MPRRNASDVGVGVKTRELERFHTPATSRVSSTGVRSARATRAARAACRAALRRASASAIAIRNVRQISFVRLRPVLQRVGEHAEIESGEQFVQRGGGERLPDGPRRGGRFNAMI